MVHATGCEPIRRRLSAVEFVPDGNGQGAEMGGSVDPAPRGVAITLAPALPLWTILLRRAFYLHLAVFGSF